MKITKNIARQVWATAIARYSREESGLWDCIPWINSMVERNPLINPRLVLEEVKNSINEDIEWRNPDDWSAHSNSIYIKAKKICEDAEKILDQTYHRA